MKNWDEYWKWPRQPLSKPKPNKKFRNPIKISTKEKTSEYDLTTLNKVTQSTIGNILRAQNQIAEILTNYPCGAIEAGP